jgi:cytochrome c556
MFRTLSSLAITGLLASFVAAAALAADLQTPDRVKMGLHILAGVYGDMDRKLAAEQYDRLPHENQEFQEGSGALRDAVAHEPAPFKGKVEATLKDTLGAAQKVADTSKTHDKAQVSAALAALATPMKTLNALFPEALRAEPGTVDPPWMQQHGGKAPPPNK